MNERARLRVRVLSTRVCLFVHIRVCFWAYVCLLISHLTSFVMASFILCMLMCINFYCLAEE